jgi:tRNA(fMet)-specific endonuclease VapC
VRKTHNIHKKNRIEVRSFFLDIQILPIDFDTVQEYGKLKANLRKTGQALADNDLWIDASAIRYNKILVTHNLRHFERIRELTIQDWY